MLTSQKILEYISKNRQASGKELSDYLIEITPRAVRKQLKSLLDKGLVRKIGRPPKVYYLLSTGKGLLNVGKVDKRIQHFINERYLFISPTGESVSGWQGFLNWCEKTKQDPIKTAKEYVATVKKFDRFRKNNLVDGTVKMKNTFKKVFLDRLLYLDFYSIERFGKTKLGQMLLYAKQSQNAELIRKLINEIRPRIISLISSYRIDGVLFVPPTVKREVQFMKELERQLNLFSRNLSVTKVKTEIIIPQKTLSRLEDRIENAKNTIIVDDGGKYNNILLIDDAVGSGATFNEIARQIRNKNLLSGKIIGLAITGSFKGFDIISEI
jgi:DNA-binding transcriptional ArsR family regulator